MAESVLTITNDLSLVAAASAEEFPLVLTLFVMLLMTTIRFVLPLMVPMAVSMPMVAQLTVSRSLMTGCAAGSAVASP